MDRRNALFALCILVLFGCDDRYGQCKKNGCSSSHDDDGPRSTWGMSEVHGDGSISYEGLTFQFGSAVTAYQARIEVRDLTDRYEEEEAEGDAMAPDAGSDAGNANDAGDAGGASDAADAGDAARDAGYPGYTYPPVYYDTTKRMVISFDPPSAVGVHALDERANAFAVVCPRGRGLEGDTTSWCIDRDGDRSAPKKIELTGTVEVLDVRTEEVSTPGVPTGRPYEMPWGWHLRATGDDLRLDVRVESRPTWSETRSYCD